VRRSQSPGRERTPPRNTRKRWDKVATRPEARLQLPPNATRGDVVRARPRPQLRRLRSNLVCARKLAQKHTALPPAPASPPRPRAPPSVAVSALERPRSGRRRSCTVRAGSDRSGWTPPTSLAAFASSTTSRRAPRGGGLLLLAPQLLSVSLSLSLSLSLYLSSSCVLFSIYLIGSLLSLLSSLV
jgi:hypothetical protein